MEPAGLLRGHFAKWSLANRGKSMVAFQQGEHVRRIGTELTGIIQYGDTWPEGILSLNAVESYTVHWDGDRPGNNESQVSPVDLKCIERGCPAS
jgi:hypothetical protein